MITRILLVMVCALLAGCRFEMPAFDAGKLEQHTTVDGRDRAVLTDLTQEQLEALAGWFAAHDEGWEKSYADVGARKFVYLSRKGASVAYFNLSGDTLYAASYSRKVTAEERLALETILAGPNR